jgi:hypothetical protein
MDPIFSCSCAPDEAGLAQRQQRHVAAAHHDTVDYESGAEHAMHDTAQYHAYCAERVHRHPGLPLSGAVNGRASLQGLSCMGLSQSCAAKWSQMKAVQARSRIAY